MTSPSVSVKDKFRVEYKGRGATSKKEIKVVIENGQPGAGINFSVLDARAEANGAYVAIPAKAASVVNTLRNVVLGKDAVRLCIVEHVLCAVAIWGLEDVLITVDGPELPLGDGSANFFIELFKSAGVERRVPAADLEITETVTVGSGDRMIIAVPDSKFSLTYLMDWDHPKIGRRWQTFDASKAPEEIATARTFASLKEHQMLGLADDSVSLTEDGFTKPLHFDDEPVRHKLLDLLGDLTLIGVNPMRVKAKFISIKGGHELDVQLARKLAPLVNVKK
jgi:UDP-3-O-[3-hydroxymyristoyl] N-acetylglucosamine deacetylase